MTSHTYSFGGALPPILESWGCSSPSSPSLLPPPLCMHVASYSIVLTVLLILMHTSVKYICYAQSMDLRNPWIVLRKVAIYTLRNKVRICCAFHGFSSCYAQTMDLRNPWIILRQVAIDTLRNKTYGFVIYEFHGSSSQ